MAHVDRLRIYPVKGLDAIELEASRITDAGTMAGDRSYALTTPDGDDERPINAKQSATLHEIRSDFDPENDVLTVRFEEDERRFHLDREADRRAAGEWFGDVLDRDVRLR